MLFSEADNEYPTEPLTKTQIFDAYVSYCKTLGERAAQRAVFFKRFRSMIGGLDETRAKSSNGKRARQIGLPDLTAARKAFTRHTGITFDE
jgi:GH24 family phage-related lysozyme (muramidase)